MTGFAALINGAPRAHQAERGAAAVEKLGAVGAFADLIKGAAGSSPYIASLIEQEADWLDQVMGEDPQAAFAALLAEAAASQGMRGRAIALRLMKRRAALLIALADLGGVWSLAEVTAALSDLADHATTLAFETAFATETSGPLAGMTPAQAGLVVLAMGKGGARELNYSSDIDVILLHNDDSYSEDEVMEARPRWTKLAQRAVKLLSEITGDGYVFRVDLRLRPNPSVTPICMSMDAAERYYESIGRTWERAALIKARPVAGNISAGTTFLDDIAPFIWRRSLDFAALEDINDIRAKIRDAQGLRSIGDLPGYNLKLGPGGIREIEFFAQTQQLAFGGRDPTLRRHRTVDALGALARAGKIDVETEEMLTNAYVAHRTLEHRFQMIDDAQTHDMPLAAEARDQVAALGGWADRGAMEAEVAARLKDVRERVQGFFGRLKSRAGAKAETNFDDLGFQRPDMVRALADRWADGGVAATRDTRARRKFAALAPVILQKLSTAGDPDDAVIQFDRFLTGLPAGVQLFSLFEANLQLLDLLSEICAAAPRLAHYLGRNAGVLDAVLDRSFFAPLPDQDALTAELAALLDGVDDYERALDTMRRWAKDHWFRIGVHVLRGLTDDEGAGQGFSDIAATGLRALMPVVEAEFARRHGPSPGRGAAVIGMGKLGSREMTATSDLDLIVVYDAGGAEASEGEKPLTISTYYARLTKMLVSALTAQTAEGSLYEVDMRLRPSGGQGPVAVSLDSFRQYQANEAWTWEHMALTRAQPVAGDASLCADIDAVMVDALSAPRDGAKTRRDVAEMRGKLIEAHRTVRDELWSLKHGDGGLMDIEFVAQGRTLEAALTGTTRPTLMLDRLADAGVLDRADTAALIDAYRLQSLLQQAERMALDGAFRAKGAGQGLKAALARIAHEPDFGALEARLRAARRKAAAIVARVLAV
ncbi:MAG: bifunctional [glutamine synthetase] adenylyltransferase/[glutamine synthetase]-adenylyl-L-tyrosine phosphorylase [Pseudomonadota bacterium]